MSRSRVGTIIGWLGALCVAAGIGLYVRQQRTAGLPGEAPAAPAGAPVDESATLPFDTSIVTGALQNGLRYFVKANAQPPNRAELRLVVNAGSVLEDDDQRGLAHVVEHLAFNGTKRFPKQEVGAFLESIGMRFGPSINAATGFDETVYSLQVPTDNVATLDRALLILEEWAHNVTFDPGEIEKERKVILEEWRLRRGAGARIQDLQLPVLLARSRYADRLPIGTPESIQNFTHGRLKQFYEDWYRPDLMAVIAVGDFEAPALVRRIEERFGAIPARQSPRARPAIDAPQQAGTAFAVATDSEATSTNVSLIHRRQPREAIRVADYRRDTVERLALGMLSARLTEVAQVPNGPFVTASAGKSRIVRHHELITLSAVVGPSGALPALSALAVERERLVKFGFAAPELSRQKENLLRGFERAIAEKAGQPSAALAAEYVRHFTIGEPVPGLEWEYDITRRFTPGITIDDVSEAARLMLGGSDRVVSVTAPKKMNIYVPSQEELQSVLAAARTATLQPWVVRVDTAPLLDPLPAPGSIASTVAHQAIGVTEWRLSNGLRVVLKPTDFKEDQIVFTAVSPGGLSLAADADYIPAVTAAQVVGTMGYGRFASGDLRRMLTGKAVNVQPVIGPYEEGLSGGSSRADLETMFQLIHLSMTAPRRDPGIFAALQGQMRNALANQASTPEFAFAAAMSRALAQDHPRSRPLEAAAVDGMDMDKSLEFYRSRFADASDFTFVFAGSFTVDGIRPLVERYLASLPATRRGEQWKDLGIRPPRGIVEREVERGLEPKSRTGLVFTGLAAVDRASSVALAAMADILQTRLRSAIREDLGGTYNVSVLGNASRVPVGQATVSIDFTADPARMDALVARVLKEIAAYRQAGPTAAELRDVQAAMLRDFENNSRQNAYIAGQLAQRYQSGEPPASVWQLPDTIRSLTAAAIHEAAKQRLDPGRYVRLTLRPAAEPRSGR